MKMAKKHRVLHLIGSPSCGGVQRLTHGVIAGWPDSNFEHYIGLVLSRTGNYLKELSAVSCGIFFLSCEPEILFDRPYRLRKIYKKIYGVLAAVKIAFFLAIKKIDLIHCHVPRISWILMISCALARRPLIVTYHGCYAIDDINTRIYETIARYWRELPIVRTYVSHNVADHYIRIQHERCNRQYHVIDNGIDVHKFKKSRNSILKAPRDMSLRIGALGRLEKIKSYDTLVHAAAILAREFDGLKFKLGGYGAEFEYLQGLIDSLGLGEVFSLVGVVEDSPGFLNEIDIFVITSESEGLPLVLLEAMAAGCTILTTAVGGIPSVVIDTVECLYFKTHDHVDLANKIKTLILNNDLRSYLSANSCRKVSNYDISKTAHDYSNIYTRMIDSGR